jgi:hypothetical protein
MIKIYQKIRKCITTIRKEVKESEGRLYGFRYYSRVMDIVDEEFKGVEAERQSMIVIRVLDNLDRLENEISC